VRNGRGGQNARPNLRPNQRPRAQRQPDAGSTHRAHWRDHLVGWAWAPGSGPKPAPGTQKQAGALADPWEKTGAACLARLALEQVVGRPTLPMEPLKKRLVASNLPQWATILRPSRALKRGSRTAAGTISRGKNYIARLEWRGSMFIQRISRHSIIAAFCSASLMLVTQATSALSHSSTRGPRPSLLP
jgi:hypothetical protein